MAEDGGDAARLGVVARRQGELLRLDLLVAGLLQLDLDEGAMLSFRAAILGPH
jgi:hypothetical protein